MCGIYGIVTPDDQVKLSFLKRQRDLMAHRGPDDAGIWLSPEKNIGLAHRRLAILDLSSTGHQPMVSQDGRFIIVFNGEVYNFQQLRTDLQQQGYQFNSTSDTEVILASYQAWGEQFLQKLNGMFSLAIYDQGNKENPARLFFARDRAGKKPFYYFQESDRFQFASELKAIHNNQGIDHHSLNYYLALGYIPHDLCFLKGVKKIPPAHAATLDISTMKLRVWRYWDLPVNQANPDITGDSLADTTESLFMDSVRLRMISDVPVGVLLSGGLDSSLVVAAAARQTSKPIKTFTVSVPGSSYDEASFAKTVSDYFSTDHHVLEMRTPAMSIIEELASFVDEPLADSSLIPSYIISKLTRENVTVALGGDGGDELFGGYNDYPVSLNDQRRLGFLPPMILKYLGKGAALLPAGIRGRNRLASLQGGPLQQLIWGSPYFDGTLRRRIFTKDMLELLDKELFEPEVFLLGLFSSGKSPVDCMTRTHFQSILPDDFLVKIDRASMANSLEMRCPFLDYRLIEFAFANIPDHWKIEGQKTRRVQKILAKRMLPADLNTERKQGFSIPMDEWLRKENCQLIRDIISFLPESINRSEVRNLMDGHMKGRANGSRLFALLMLAMVLKNGH